MEFCDPFTGLIPAHLHRALQQHSERVQELIREKEAQAREAEGSVGGGGVGQCAAKTSLGLAELALCRSQSGSAMWSPSCTR